MGICTREDITDTHILSIIPVDLVAEVGAGVGAGEIIDEEAGAEARVATTSMKRMQASPGGKQVGAVVVVVVVVVAMTMAIAMEIAMEMEMPVAVA